MIKNGLKAANLYNSKNYDVYQEKNLLFLIIGKYYFVLIKTDINKNTIEYGFLYSFYEINDKIYDGFFTTDYRPFFNTFEQLSLF